MTKKAGKNNLQTAKVKTTGTYLERSKELAAALEFALTEALDVNVLYEVRGEDPKKPAYWWDLPDHVSVEITRSSGADPRIWVFRRDPTDPAHSSSSGNDWKNEWFERNYEDKLYHVGAIAKYVREQLEYNRKKLAEHKENQKALGEELVGIAVPPGMSIERDPKTGHYEVCMQVSLKEINASETKTVIEAFQQLKAVVAPLEPKKETVPCEE